MMTPHCALDAKAVAGETPVWCAVEGALYWIDVMRPSVHRFVPESGEAQSASLPELVGSIAVREGGGLVAAMKSGFCFIDFPSGAVQPIIDPEAHLPHNTFNDGKCDRRGRFWAGTSWLGPEGEYADPPTEPTGSLYRLDPDLSCHKVADGIGQTNTLAWSPDERTMYYGDSSAAAVIYACDFDAERGTIDNRRVFVRTDEGAGVHDGSAIDADGYLWTTFWSGWRLVRYTPDGRIDRVVEMPVQYPTACTFGGEDLATLYITTARWTLSGDSLERQPFAGGLFTFEPGVCGVSEPKFAG